MSKFRAKTAYDITNPNLAPEQGSQKEDADRKYSMEIDEKVFDLERDINTFNEILQDISWDEIFTIELQVAFVNKNNNELSRVLRERIEKEILRKAGELHENKEL